MKQCQKCNIIFADEAGQCPSCGESDIIFIPFVNDSSSTKKQGKRIFSILNKTPLSVKIIILILIIILAISVFANINLSTTGKTTKLNFENIGQLATQTAYYSRAQKLEKYRNFLGINLPLTHSQAIFTYSGEIKAGINFEEITYIVNPIGKTVTVTIPAPIIISNEIDENSCVTLDETKNPTNPFTNDEFSQARIQLKEDALDDAIANGLLENAKKNAQQLIKTFLLTDYPDYEFTFLDKE